MTSDLENENTVFFTINKQVLLFIYVLINKCILSNSLDSFFDSYNAMKQREEVFKYFINFEKF